MSEMQVKGVIYQIDADVSHDHKGVLRRKRDISVADRTLLFAEVHAARGDVGVVVTPPSQYSVLSIAPDAGDVTYVIELTNDTRAYFGPGKHPIMILPYQFGDTLLHGVGFLFADPADPARATFVPHDADPSELANVPKSAALTFTCDRADLENAWQIGVDGAGHHDKMDIPFFLNLYDKETDRPVWTYDKHRHHEHTEHDDVKFTVHGGIHPGKPSQSFY